MSLKPIYYFRSITTKSVNFSFLMRVYQPHFCYQTLPISVFVLQTQTEYYTYKNNK